jgi:phosphatidylinositol-4,5-bisphosphate 3-kinase
LYPSLESILAFSEDLIKDGAEVAQMNQGLKEIFLGLRTLLEQDPFHELHEQEQKVIWGMRHTCMESYPALLPKVLECVEWNDHKEVSTTNLHVFSI